MKVIISRIAQLTVSKYNQKGINDIFYIEVNPGIIEHIKMFRTNDIPVLGENAKCGAVDGFWDMLKIPYKKHHFYKSISERINNNTKWEHTSMHKVVSASRNKTALEDYYYRLDTLIETIQINGFKSQYELGKTEINNSWIKIRDKYVPPEIIVGMDRNGRFFQLTNGRRRLAIAQILNVREIPAILSLYHSKAIDKFPAKRRKITGDVGDFKPIIL